jgi:hypothetical protein
VSKFRPGADLDKPEAQRHFAVLQRYLAEVSAEAAFAAKQMGAVAA